MLLWKLGHVQFLAQTNALYKMTFIQSIDADPEGGEKHSIQREDERDI